MAGGQSRNTILAILLAGATAPAAAWGQSADATPSANAPRTGKNPAAPTGRETGGDIVVTADKRSERITDVPFAITAVGQREIRDRGSVSIRDLQYSIPGLNIQELSPGSSRTTLRGINPGAGTGLPIVGTYVDDVGITIDQQQRDTTFPLVDLARVEVLRGPQGTLYGQGSIAGTIRYITQNPSLTRVGGFVEGNVYDQTRGGTGYRVNGALGVPLIDDKVGLRVAGGYDHIAGWIDYPGANRQDANLTERWFVRPKLYARLSDALTMSVLYQYYDQRSDTDNISGVSPYARPGRPELYPAKDTSHLVNVILDYDFGPATLTSSSGYLTRNLVFQAPLAVFRADFDTVYKQFTQELRITSNGSGPLKATGGLFYRNFRSEIDRIFFAAGTSTPTPVGRRVGDDPVDSRSFAVFGDATYTVASDLDLSAGARYFYDERQAGSTIPVAPLARDTFRTFAPRFSAKYAWTPGTSVYLTASKGFRSGGFNGSGTSFGPESLWNYEGGLKSSLMGGRVFIDLAAFYIDYRDRQANGLLELVPGVFLTETRNVGKASGPGVEGSVNLRLGAGLQLDATAAYNDIKSDATNAEVVKGQRFDFVPAFTASAALSQRIPLGSRVTGMWRVDYQHSDPYSAITRQGLPNGTVATLENFRNEAQDYVNLRVGAEFGAIGVYVDAQNITNERTLLFPFSPIVVSNEGTRPRPTSYGLTLRWNFDR